MPDGNNADNRISREDLDSTLRSAVGDVEEQVAKGARRLAPAAIGAGGLMLVAAYFLGRRVGATRSTVVEVRRI